LILIKSVLFIGKLIKEAKQLAGPFVCHSMTVSGRNPRSLAVIGIIISSTITNLVFLVLTSNFAFFAASDCVGSISAVEYEALEALYESTDGEDWRYLPGSGIASHWHFPAALSEPCGTDVWEGLRCNATDVDEAGQCYVSEIALNSHYLVGTIPSDIGMLTRLEILDLGRNVLRGSLPGAIGQLVSLLLLDLQDNYLSQQLPSEVATLDSVVALYLNDNIIHGTIPTEIGRMTHVFGVYLEGNYLESSIPSELGSMDSLGELYIHTNSITGSIPTEICDLPTLFKLIINENLLSGTISSCFGQMTTLRMLSLFTNALSGPLPPQLGNMSNLFELSCKDNYLSGSLPLEIYNLDKVEQLLLTGNYISGTLAPSISLLISVYQIELADNLMSGALPSELFAISGLASVFLDYNSISSTIPDAISNSEKLQYFAISYNNLIGTLPNQLFGSRKLLYVTLASNYLSGTLPSSISKASHMKEMSLAGNYFTGTIHALGNLSNLEFVSFSDCLLTGSFPSGFSELSKLKSFTAVSNCLSGSLNVPISLSRMIIQNLEIGSNYLTGSLPAEFASFRRLEELIASHNLLTGNIEFLFNRTGDAGLGQLEYLDLSNNAFDGTIPASMFVGARLRPLSTVVLYQNCFTGSLPASICEAGNLTTLILDSVSSAPACDVRFTGLWKDLFKVVIGKRSLLGTIPDCIWLMRSLQTVHLAGNGLQGTLPADVLSPVIIDADVTKSESDDYVAVNRTVYLLKDVNLASNTLVGTIPLSWQQWPWKSLDLSGNKLTGILSEGFVVNSTCSESEQETTAGDDYYAYYDDGGSPAPTDISNASQICGSIDVTVNRLSGRIPGAFRYAQAVNILDGNLFDCDGKTMPEYDPMSSEYICGSSDFNNSLALWICCLFVNATVAAWISGNNLLSKVKHLIASLMDTVVLSRFDEPHAILPADDEKSVSRFLTFLQRIAILSLALQCFYITVCMVSYMGMKASDAQYDQAETGSSYTETFGLSTHTYQYAWLSTVAYLHGSVPVIILMMYLFVSLSVIGCFLSSPNGAAQAASVSPGSESVLPDRSRSTTLRMLAGQIPPSSEQSLQEKLLVSDIDSVSSAITVLPTVKSISWFTGTRLVVLIVLHAVVMISVNILYIYVLLTGLSSSSFLFLVQVTLSVFKLCWNRFYVGFVVAAPLASTAAQSISTSVALQCSSFMVLFTFIISPVLATFFSDDTCLRYFITGQAAVDSSFQTDVYECYILCNLECASFCEYTAEDETVVTASVVPSWQYSYQCSSSLLVNYTPVLLYSFAITGLLVPLLQYLYCQFTREDIEKYFPQALMARYITNTIYAYRTPDDANDGTLARLHTTGSKRSPGLFNGISVISRAYMNIGVLITFGMASPLLAVAVSMDCISLYLIWRVLIQRYLLLFVFPAIADTSVQERQAVKVGGNFDEDFVVRGYLERLTRSTNVVPVENTRCADASRASANLGASTGLGRSAVLWMVVWIAGLFWGLFVFDMYGDIYGAVDGLCMISVPTVGGALVFFLASRYRRFQRCYGTSSFYFRVGNGFGKAGEDGSVKSPIFDPQGNSTVFDDNKL
jgi:Leucine-rich repeat (LRR) protein